MILQSKSSIEIFITKSSAENLSLPRDQCGPFLSSESGAILRAEIVYPDLRQFISKIILFSSYVVEFYR